MKRIVLAAACVLFLSMNAIAAEPKITTAFLSKSNSQDVGKFEVHVEGISPNDVRGFYVDNTCLDEELFKKRALLQEVSNGFIMKLDFKMIKGEKFSTLTHLKAG